MKLVSLSLLTFSFSIKRISKEGQLPDPNFIWGLSLVNILILASQIELLDTSCHAIRKVFLCFKKEYGKYPKWRAKGSF